jgi:tripeptidyl-peptidase I
VTNTFTLQTVDGGSDPQGNSNAGVEANLDIQYTVGIATNVPVNFVSVGASNSDGVDGFLDVVNFLSAESNVPNTFTTSYGFNEDVLDPSTAR